MYFTKPTTNFMCHNVDPCLPPQAKPTNIINDRNEMDVCMLLCYSSTHKLLNKSV